MRAESSWQSRDSNNHTKHIIVIAKATPYIVIAKATPIHRHCEGHPHTSSLRRPKAYGNLGIGHDYSFTDFFCFLFLYLRLVVMDCFTLFAITRWRKMVNSFFLRINKRLVICGLLRRFTPRNDEGR